MKRIGTYLLLGLAGILALAVAAAPARANSGEVVINEVLVGNNATNLDPDYFNYSGWIELYNPPGGVGQINLQNYSLTIDPAVPAMWKFPSGTIIRDGGYLLVWADEQNKLLHTNFELDMDGEEEIVLFSPTGARVDTVVTAADQLVDVSYGRLTSGEGTWGYFDLPTPGAANSGGREPEVGEDYPARAAAPTISPAAGFYDGPVTVSISAEPGAEIRYTTDGSRPTETSPLYTAPFVVDGTDAVRAPAVRARAWVDGKLSSLSATATYIIGFETDLPVVSVASDPRHFFDNRIGIYVAGNNGITGRCSSKKVNWNRPWERPTSMELFLEDGSLAFRQDVGIEIQGNCSRTLPQKSFEIKARKVYGDNDIDYQVFPDNPLDEYRRLVLRGGGSFEATKAMIKDPFAQALAEETMDLDMQQYRPAVLFINGQYWGLYSIRDKGDEALIEQNYGLDESEFDMLESNRVVITGDVTAWVSLMTLLKKSPSNQAIYDAAIVQLDVPAVMDYFIHEIFVANESWPMGNIRYWRPRQEDARWRYLMWDLDGAFQAKRVRQDTLQYVLKSKAPGATPFWRMMENPGFRAAFVQRFASHIAISYVPARTTAALVEFRDLVKSEIPRQAARWPEPKSVEAWNAEIAIIDDFLTRRPAVAMGFLNKAIGNKGTTTMTVDVSGGQGDVQVAGVAPLAYPFSGAYFKTLPLTFTAVPAQGYRFVKWQETNSTDPTFTVTVSGPQTYTAVFEALPQVLINEIHYNPAAGQGADSVYEFVELVNAEAESVDLSGFTFRGKTLSLTFGAAASIAAGERIVLALTPATYSSNGYQVFGWTGGELSNSSETLSLSDADGNVVDTVTYYDGGSWPTAADGTGPSLSRCDGPSCPGAWTTLGWAPSAANNGTPGAQNFPPAR